MKKILVLEDQGAVAELIKLQLEKAGFEAAVALDGVEGLDILGKINPDLIILDVLMPRMDGFQFFKTIKEKEETKDIPVLVMTVRGAMKDSFESMGVDSFIAKPFEPDDLVLKVQKLLDSSLKSTKTIKTAVLAGTDDDRLEDMRKQLSAKGYKITLAKDGVEALSKALEILPDLFMVQFDMPTMNADEITLKLNSYPKARKISVVVYSPLKTKEGITHSLWGRFLTQNQNKETRGKEAPLKVIDKFDSNAFLDKIKDFM